MKPVCVVFLLVLCALLDTGVSISCPSNACDWEGAKAGCKPDPTSCPSGYALKEANVCSCCKVCKKILCTYYISMN